MKSSATWTVTVAAAALLMLPGAAAAQTPPATQPPATQSAPPAADAAQPPAATQGSAQEHLRQAKTTLEELGTANLPARARGQVAELKKHMTTLEGMAAGNTGAVGATQTPSPTNTKTRVSRATANWGNEVAAMDKIVTQLLGVSPTGTSGTTSTNPPTAGTLDDATRTKLTEFRTHLTAFATAMSTQTPTAGDTPKTEPSAPTPATEPTQPPATQPPATQPPTAQPPAQSAPPATEPAGAVAPAAQKVDAEAAKRHLTEARNALSQMTQLPEAGKLTGDVRTQVTQLITNFNELITTQSNWPAAYAKVSANLTALLGPDTGAAPASGTEGAVGTSGGGMALDPPVRDKLAEMRKSLAAFERASGGGEAVAAAKDAPAPAPTKPAEPTSPPTEPTAPPATAAAPASEPAPAAAASDALSHVAAIEALLKSQNESGGMTLDKAQVELLRTHIAELRKLLEKK